jgi:hypothetical protein
MLLNFLVCSALSGPLAEVPYSLSREPTWGRTGLDLLVNEDAVRRELGVSGEQLTSAKDLSQELMTGKGQVKPSQLTSALGKMLTKRQRDRLREISWQVRGAEALRDPELADPLRLSPEQRAKINTLWADEVRKLGDELKRLRFKSDADRKAFIQKRLASAGEQMLRVLSEDQREAYQKALGSQFSAVPAS